MVLPTTIVEPDFCDYNIIQQACCVLAILHNFVRKRDRCNYDENIVDTA